MASKVTGVVRAVVIDHAGDTRYVTVGRATTDESGRIAIKIDALPYNPTQWTGWLNIFPLDGSNDKF